MRVNRMRIRFEDPHVAAPQAEALARRVAALVTGERAGVDDDASDTLARPVASRVSDALHAVRTAGRAAASVSSPGLSRTAAMHSGGPAGAAAMGSGAPSAPVSGD